MNLRPREREREDLGIDLTPLIDVVFLLLIFFMVSTTFQKEADLNIDLPKASPTPVAAESERITVAVDKTGHYSINDQPLADTSVEALKAALLAAVGDNRQLPFIIRADAITPHQSVVTVMDIAGQLGFRKLSIATVQAAGN